MSTRRVAIVAAVAAAGVLAVAGSASFPGFLALRSAAVFFAGLGPAVVFTLGGRASLGHGALAALGAYAYAATVRAGAPPATGLLAAMIVATAGGALIGAVFAHLRGPTFAVATLGVQVAVDRVALRLPTWTGGHMGLVVPTDPSALILPVAGAAAFVAGAAAWGGRGAQVRRWIAVRDRPEVAIVSGVDPRGTFAGLVALSGALSGLGGALLVPLSGLVHPAQFTLTESIELLVVAALGGGSLSGTFLASAASVTATATLGPLAQYRSLLWAAVLLAVAMRSARRKQPPC